MPALRDDLRLGWALAEVQGRHRRSASEVPVATVLPEGLLPLRPERSDEDARGEARRTLVSLVRRQRVGDHRFEPALDETLAGRGPIAPVAFFQDWDARVQDALTEADERRANAYLLGRGLAECYWALTPATPEHVLGEDRRTELTRMLGRLTAGAVHPVTPAAVSGSIAAWAEVVDTQAWRSEAELEVALREQVRQWYQLVVLGQDPTTLIRPYVRLGSLRSLGRSLRLFWPQVVAGLVVLALLTGFLTVVGDGRKWLTSLLAAGGLGAFTLAGLAARGQNAAQKLALRLRQDAYTDLVAVSITVLPPRPDGSADRRATERAVRNRGLTASTPAP